MIAVDTSARMAILQKEPQHRLISELLADAIRPKISAATVAEALVVALRRGIVEEMRRLIDRIEPDVIPADAETSRRVVDIYRQ